MCGADLPDTMHPPDILNVAAEETEIVWPGRGGIAVKPGPDTSLIKPAADMIDKAERPFLIAGSGVGASGCDQEIAGFIEKSGIPFALINTARGMLPDEHPLVHHVGNSERLWCRSYFA